MNKEIYDLDYQALKQFLNGIYRRETQRKSAIIDVYVGFADRKMITGSGWVPPKDYDCLSRPWYQLAVKSNSIVFTVPYLDARTKEMVITVAEPIKKRWFNHCRCCCGYICNRIDKHDEVNKNSLQQLCISARQ